MRDPLDDKPRAHDVLGVDLDAGSHEINGAYARRCQEDKARRAELTHAWQRLRRVETRLEEELWFYEIADDAVALPPPESCSALGCPPPPFVLDLAFTDLGGGRARADQAECSAAGLRLEHLSQYESPIEYPPWCSTDDLGRVRDHRDTTPGRDRSRD